MLCAWRLCRCQGCCQGVRAGCGQAAPAELSSALSPGSSQLCVAGVGVLPQLFFFLSHLQVGSQTGGALLLELSCTGAPLPPEQLALEMLVLALLWATGQEEEQAALLAMQLTEMLWACHKQRGANLVPCWSWDVPPSLQTGELMGNSLCPRINYAIIHYYH